MTQEEADKIAKVIRTADSGCSVCVRSLCELLTEARLGFSFEMTTNMVTVQADWSDDPDDTVTLPEVVVTRNPN